MDTCAPRMAINSFGMKLQEFIGFTTNHNSFILREINFESQISILDGKLPVHVGLAGATVSFSAEPVIIDQGPEWTASARKDFYSRDQGSRIMPLRWIAALKQTDGQPFMADSLGRYGYLPNKASRPAGLPIGFTVARGSEEQEIGMNCSACHTRQIEVNGTAYLIDGGPGIVDFQSFLSDLDTAVNTVLTNDQAFTDFAHAVLGPSAAVKDKKTLREAVKAWHLPYHTLI